VTRIEADDQLLSGIIVYGFSLAFGLVIASLEALRPTPTGFTIQLSWWTVVALLAAAAVMGPVFYTIVHSRRKYLRRAALGFVVVVSLGAFLYPMRVVPSEKLRPVFIGLAVAIGMLSVMATLLFLLHRFFENEERR
jgi:hypothetical protein